MTTVLAYPLPPDIPRADDVLVAVNGTLPAIGRTPVCDYAICAADGPVTIEVMTGTGIASAVIRPAAANVGQQVHGGRLHLTLDRPRQISIEIPGRQPLYLFVQPLGTAQPSGKARSVRRLEAGRIHELGEVVLSDGEELHLEGGAVLRGWVRAVGARDVRISGHGVIDTSTFPAHYRRLIILDDCREVDISGITTIGSPSWTLVLGACEDVRVRGMNQIGWHVSTDGIDICGSRRVLVEDCFLRNNDDCVVIKAIGPSESPNDRHGDFRRDVEDVVVQRCTCYNDHAGNVFEIGFETRCAAMRRITFRDCDVIGAHGEGGVFTIHNGDCAVIEDVLYEDIRIEHFYDKFIDFRVLDSRYSHEGGQGLIRRVTLRRIRAIEDRYNTVSLIGGMNEAGPVSDVQFHDVRFGTQPILSPDDLHLFSRNAVNITFSAKA